MPKQGINPITIRTAGQPDVVLSRIHIGANGQMKKIFSILITKEGGKDGSDVIVLAQLDEDRVIEGLGHLFPRGELARAHE